MFQTSGRKVWSALLCRGRPVRLASTTPIKSGAVPPPPKVQELLGQLRKVTAVAESAAVEEAHMGDPLHSRPDMERLRVIPKDKTFYMNNPPHEELLALLNNLINRYKTLPTLDPSEYQPAPWLSFQRYMDQAGRARLSKLQYRHFIRAATRLHMIEPQLMPAEVASVLGELQSDTDRSVSATTAAARTLDHQGRAAAVGRRKTSSARVLVARAQESGTGTVLVNGKPIDQYFNNIAERSAVVYPLKVVGDAGAFNVSASVTGGGVSGQADAVAHAIAQALRIHNPLLGPRLKRAGCLTRDVRHKERKKPGLAKARKAYGWVKR